MTVHARSRGVQLVGLAIAVLVASGCSVGPAATPTSPVVMATAAPPTAEELAAIRFRTENSLPADLAHVRAVATDPTAGTEFGVPLLPSEFNELMSRSNNVQDIITIVIAEAAKAPGDFCGQYIDNANEGALTSLWKANELLHEVSIRGQIRPNAPVAFGACRFSQPEQDAAMEGIRSIDDDWMRRDIPAAIRSYGFSITKDVLEMQISSAVPGAADIVRRHYETALQLPAGMLVVMSDGTGAALRPGGTLQLFVLRPNGKPVGPNALGISWESTDLPGLRCGVGDMGYGVPSDGRPAEIPCQQGTWKIEVWERGVGDVIGRGRVEVRAGRTARLTITLTREPNANPE